MALDLGGNKKKQNDKSKYSIVELSLFKPGKKKYAEFDYEVIRKKQLKEGDSSGDDERFHDKEALEIVKRLEAKYGGRKDKKGRKIQFGTEDDFMDKRAGYDLDDDFIDDSEAYDELIPSTMDTAKGGFYVNKGKLEFKSRHEELDESDLSDIEDQPQKKGKKRMIGSGDEGADTESISDPNITVEKTIAPSRPPTISIPTTKARMTGAPPTKRFAHSSHGESPNQRAANAIKKKRLVGMPPTFAKKKSLQNAVNQREDEMFGFLRDMAGGEIPEVDDDIVEVVSASALQGPANKETVTSTVSSPLPTVITENAIPSTSNSGKENMNVLSSPQKKRSLAPMTDTLAKMIDNFKKVTQGLSVPGQKKRLQNSHVDMVIAIEEQCMKDGYTVHEKARVSQTLADFCGIQKGSLYARCMKRKEDNKAAIASTSSPPRPPSSGIINKNIGSNLTAQASVLPQKSVPTIIPSTTLLPTKPSSVILTPPSSTSTSTSKTPLHSWNFQQKIAAQSILANFLNHPGINRQVIVMLREKIDSGEIGYDEFVKLQPLILTQTQKQSSNGITKVNTSGSSCTTGSSNVAPTSTHNQQGTQGKLSGKASTSVSKPQTLAQAVALAKLPSPPVVRSVFSPEELKCKMNENAEALKRAINTAIANSKAVYNKKVATALAAGKPQPEPGFLWTDRLAAALKAMMDFVWNVILHSTEHGQIRDKVAAYMASDVLDYFQKQIKMSRLFIEFGRRNPDKLVVLTSPIVKESFERDGIDLNSITMLHKPLKTNADTTNTLSSSQPMTANQRATVRPPSRDDIQVIDALDNGPTTSKHSLINGMSPKGSSPLSATSIPNNALTGLSQAQLTEMATALQQLGTMRSADPQQLLALQGMLMQVVTQSQVKAVESQRRNEEKKKEEERHKLEAQQANLKTIEALRKKVEDEREAKKKAREEEKHRIIAQKKAEAAAAKEKALEEKRLKQEEEKKQKLAEKARKAEEERQRRIQEQAEKERKMLEERERIAKEEAERVKLEEEEKRRIEMVRVKMEEQQAESLRIKKQEEQVAAVRAATQAVHAQQTTPINPQQQITVSQNMQPNSSHNSFSNDFEAKPIPVRRVSQGNLAGPTCGFSSPSAHHGMMRSPHQPISASPQYQGNFGYPNSHGSNSIAQSPQAMTPPSSGYTTAHRSPALQSIQQHNSSPYQQQPVQSPMNSSINQQTHIGLQQHNQIMNQHRSGVIPHQQSMQQMSFTNNTSPVQQVNQVLPNHSVEGIVHHQQGFGMTQHSNHSVSSVSNNNKMAVQQSQGYGHQQMMGQYQQPHHPFGYMG